MKQELNTQSGSFLASAVVVTATFLFLALGMATYVFNRYHLAQRGIASTNALQAARGGLDSAIANINNNEYYYRDCSCMGSEIALQGGGGNQDKTTYTILNTGHTTDSPRQSFEMYVTVLGKVYDGNSGTVVAQRAVRATLTAIKPDGSPDADFVSVVQTGYGTLDLNGDSLIIGTLARLGGNVLATGTSSNEGRLLGDYTWAYNHVCPTTGGSGYPRKCSPTEVIAANAQGCQSGHCPEADGTVELHVPGPSASNINGRASGGIVLGDAIGTPPELPDIGREKIKNAVVGTTTGNVSCAGGTSLGTKPGETTKITGNLTVNGLCYLRGDLWVQGYLQVTGGSATDFYTADSDNMGNRITSAPIVMVDGIESGTARSISIRQHATSVLENTYGIGKILVSFYCTAGFGCPDGTVTGNNLFNSSNTTYVDVEPGTGNTQNHSGLVLYSRWGRTHVIRDSNITGAVLGQSAQLSGTGPLVDFRLPTDLNLGGRQGKNFRIKSYTETALPSSNASSLIVDNMQDNSMAIGADGLPLIAYTNAGQPRVVKCHNIECTASTTTALSTFVFKTEDIAIGSDGLPVVVARNPTGPSEGRLLFIKCYTMSCTSHGLATLTTNQVLEPRIAIGSDGNPIIAYQDFAGSDLRVTHCSDIGCGAYVTSVVDTVAAVTGQRPSIAIGIDLMPVISYVDYTNGDMKLAKCSTIGCSGTPTLRVLYNGTGSSFTTISSVAIGADGNPAVAFAGTTSMRVYKCSDHTCASGSTNVIDTGSETFESASIKIGVDGLPAVSYTIHGGGTRIVKFVRCGDTTCSINSDKKTLANGGEYYYLDMSIGREGYPMVSYRANSNIYHYRCASLNCS